MKKIILSLLIAACMFCTMVSCGTSEKNEETDLNTENRNEVQTENEDIKQIIVPYYDENVKKYGYCTADGELVIAPEFDEANFFYENAAAVRVDNLWGFVNETGVFIVEPKFHYAHNFSEGLASVRLDDLNGESKWGFIDKTGNFVISPEFDGASSFVYGYSSVNVGYYFGAIDKTGELVVEPEFGYIGYFSENGLASARDVYGGFGFINSSGEVEIELRFDEGWEFTVCEGTPLAPVCLDGKWGFINENGEFEIEPMFDDASHFAKNGIAPVSLGGKWGCIDIKGNWTIEPQFDRLMNPRNGLISFAVGTDPYTQKWGYIDEQGNVVLDAIYDSAGPFNDGVANVRIGDFQNGIEHYINREGEIIRPK